MTPMRKLAVALLAFTFVLASCGSGGDPAASPRPEGATVRFDTADGTVELTGLEIADSDEERINGLMGRESLRSNGGMLFVFDERVREPFWMKDTLIPLSIAFWNEDGTIVAILDMQPCHLAMCKLYRPSTGFVGALEMNLGSFQRLGIQEGDIAEIDLP